MVEKAIFSARSATGSLENMIAGCAVAAMSGTPSTRAEFALLASSSGWKRSAWPATNFLPIRIGIRKTNYGVLLAAG